MRRNVNKLATLVMTGMLAASMSFGAFADNETDASTEAFELVIPKKVNTDTRNKTYAPETTFDLMVAAGPSDKTSVELQAGKNKETYTVKQGTSEQAKGITVTGAKFTSIGKDSVIAVPEDGVYKSEFKVSVPKSLFTEPGVYSFTVNEKSNKFDKNYKNYTGVKYDENTYIMYVSVVNEQNTDGSYVYANGKAVLKIDTAVIADKSGEKIQTITNTFGDNDKIDTTHDLTVTKKVTGNAGNQEKVFYINVSIKPKENLAVEAPADQYFYLTDAEGNEISNPILADGIARQLKLASGKSFKIQGLTGDYDVYVSEVEAGADGYKTSYEIAKDGDYNTSEAKPLADKNAKVILSAVADEATLTIINDRQNVTPTGVAMDIAPYALMVALAGGAGFTFLRKKESYED